MSLSLSTVTSQDATLTLFLDIRVASPCHHFHGSCNFFALVILLQSVTIGPNKRAKVSCTD
jgi:hypothetical protein